MPPNILQYRRPPKFKPMIGAAEIKNLPSIPADAPRLSMTLVESIAAKKFLLFALDDIRYQLLMLSKDKSLTIKQFKEAKDGAVLISEYLAGQIAQIDETLKANDG